MFEIGPFGGPEGRTAVVFTSAVTDHWISDVPADLAPGDVFVVVDPSLAENRAVSLIRVSDGPAVLALTPQRAANLSLTDRSRVDDAFVTSALDRADITLNDPDHVFYLPRDQQDALRAETLTTETRVLTDRDAEAFAAFTAEAPEDDLDEAFVELDHWLVFGTFVDGELVAAASMYPWGETTLADLGVITLPRFRGRGLGRATVRAMSAAAIERGYEPQYRCQLDNAASVALAAAAGFAHFGQWQVILP